MRSMLQHSSWALCVLLGLVNAQARESALTAIPDDTLAFAIVHNLADASRSIDDLATLVQAPSPDLLGWSKEQAGIANGLDEQGDAAIVLTSVDPEPTVVLLAPIANFADLCSALDVEGPDAGVIEVQVAGHDTVMGRKGDYAAFAPPRHRDALERLLASTTNLEGDGNLPKWLGANQASVVVTPRGIKQLLPKLTNGIRTAQAQIRTIAGANGEAAAAGLNLYAELFTAAEAEVELIRLGVRIDAARNVQLIKLVQFAPGGEWAKWASMAEAPDGDLLAGFPNDPFVVALGGVFPSGAMDGLMKLSVKLMQDQPGFRLAPEQAQKYVELSTAMTRSVRSMRMLLGVPEPGTGLYGKTSAVMVVDDSRRFLDQYEKSLASMSQLAQETKSPIIPAATVQRVSLGETEVLEVTMKTADMTELSPPGGPDLQAIMQTIVGPSGQLKVYVAPADEHAVLMTYTSLEQFRAALDDYRSRESGLTDDSNVAEVAAALPVRSQFVAYVSLGGIADVARQFVPSISGGKASAILDLADCPPIGIGAMATPSDVEGRLVLTAKTLRAIGAAVANARGVAAGAADPQR
jgi:hypothetical protein